tara:strand:+ start:482 stop:709 length:228 start_codon:yes stop_codon:yes gene_type:complete
VGVDDLGSPAVFHVPEDEFAQGLAAKVVTDAFAIGRSGQLGNAPAPAGLSADPTATLNSIFRSWELPPWFSIKPS